ncbi:MAG TPA: PA2779 family protein [Noviherbaspirillum sp.]|jgi:hypothetical protein|uniref:PA2779 family protein n=1 Tax=Noviherbaspirillum sp. TaxID=1926288 RepID=UPI002DDCE5FF|nr:PA2779 family protein [Noviherbaspirillum sp.]HEV2609976.1 PA2779 family protein [Noviherbaspirillum sp.]
MSHFKRFIASFLIVCLTSITLPMQAFAAIVSTEEATGTITAGTTAERERITGFLARDDIRKSLEAQGVDPQAAIDRVGTLSDEEVQQLAGRIDQMPAGGDVLGVLFTVFIILLVTDILGFTKIFPFTRSVR